MGKLPVQLGTAQVAKMLNTDEDPWDAQKVKRWFKSTGAGEKRGGRWVTTPAKLAAHWPEVYQRVLVEAFEEE